MLAVLLDLVARQRTAWGFTTLVVRRGGGRSFSSSSQGAPALRRRPSTQRGAKKSTKASSSTASTTIVAAVDYATNGTGFVAAPILPSTTPIPWNGTTIATLPSAPSLSSRRQTNTVTDDDDATSLDEEPEQPPILRTTMPPYQSYPHDEEPTLAAATIYSALFSPLSINSTLICSPLIPPPRRLVNDNNNDLSALYAEPDVDFDLDDKEESSSTTVARVVDTKKRDKPAVVMQTTMMSSTVSIPSTDNEDEDETAVSSVKPQLDDQAEKDELYTARDFNITIPKILSPSALKEYENCPQSFFFQYILKLKQPTNLALAKGSMCHAALEDFLGLDVHDRNLTVLHNLYRKHWAQHRGTDTYKSLFDTVPAEVAWGRAGLACLSRYYRSEPIVPAPNPVQRETWVRAALAENITVRGIVDRLDLVRDDDNDSDAHESSPPATPPRRRPQASGGGRKGDVVLRLLDYKTGKAPDLKYSPAMNAKIEREAWDQLVLYSLLLRESKNTPIRFLRLVYLGGDDDGEGDDAGTATIWNKRLEQRDMDDMKIKVLKLWSEIVEKLSADDPFVAFQGCHRSFCYCHQCRTKFAPHVVWQPPPPPGLPSAVRR
jgi:hypothetical protein